MPRPTLGPRQTDAAVLDRLEVVEAEVVEARAWRAWATPLLARLEPHPPRLTPERKPACGFSRQPGQAAVPLHPDLDRQPHQPAEGQPDAAAGGYPEGACTMTDIAPILAALADAGQPLSYAELHARLPHLSEGSVVYAVRQAFDRGLIERVGRGLYRLAPEPPAAA
jgi:hypothetical protein